LILVFLDLWLQLKKLPWSYLKLNCHCTCEL
jgi:hypothetical protein